MWPQMKKKSRMKLDEVFELPYSKKETNKKLNQQHANRHELYKTLGEKMKAKPIKKA